MQVKKGEIFNSVQVASLPRNTFDLTHQHATTMNFSMLVPICTLEAVPGDLFDISSETFLRFQPMITPMMHRCDFTVHYFFVPNRILWPGWEDFITGNLALSSGLSQPAAPYFTSDSLISLTGRFTPLNYMGVEVNAAAQLSAAGIDVNLNALPLAAYQKIYWDYYVPRELVTPSNDFVPLSNGDNSASVLQYALPRYKGWLRDYFTSALPYAQKGDDVALPIGNIPETSLRRQQAVGDGASFIMDGVSQPGAIAGSGIAVNAQSETPLSVGTLFFPETPVGTTTINDLRRAMRLQEWLEKNARAGTRYSESLRVHFNVTSSDARLQRAEYITGVKAPIIVSEVLNTTGESSGLPQGNMAGHGIGIGESYRDKFYCEEHGWIIGLLSVTPRPAYTSGIPRFFTKRSDFMDYYWYEFANIGEQEIENIEIQTDFGGSGLSPTGVFGYIPRYAEYKFKNDMITGDFADSSSALQPGSLRSWVMQRHFGNSYDGNNAVLNENFIKGDIISVASAPFAVEETPIMVQQINKIKVSRLMPVFGTPSF